MRLAALEAELRMRLGGEPSGAIDDDRLYTVNEAAALLRAGRSSVYELVESGDLPVIRTAAKKGFKLKGSDLRSFLDSRRVGGPAISRLGDLTNRLKSLLKK